MNTIFADTLYWVALINPQDQWRTRVLSVVRSLGRAPLLTTESVLVEVLNFYAETDGHTRRAAAANVRAILVNLNIEIVPQAHDAFLAGLALYESRLDKNYSLTDCISMNTMRERGITGVLTHDHHFAQEGFTVLL